MRINGYKGESMSIVNLSNENFEAEVMKSDVPVLVDFFADWCGPCKMISPIVKELANEYRGQIKVGKLNIDQGQEIASRFGVMGIPTLAMFKSGQRVGEVVGAMPKGRLEAFISQHIKK